MKTKKILLPWFIAGLFFIPFNSFTGFSFMGEFKNDANALLLLIGVAFLGMISLYRFSIVFPYDNSTYKMFLLFLSWILISFCINLPEITQNFFKQTTGINRFARQLVSLLISGLFFFTFFYNSLHYIKKGNVFRLIRKIFFISFLIVSFCGLLEFLILKLELNQLLPLYELFDYFPFTEVRLDYDLKRLKSVTYEPPALAMYLITTAGWMFSYIITEKGLKKYVPMILVLFFAIVSGSRTALVVIVFQLLIFSATIFSLKKYNKLITRAIVILIVGITLVASINYRKTNEFIDEKIASLDFSNVDANISNQSRLGIQYTSILVFVNNPIFGVGFGQQAFHASQLYPYWATGNNWEFEQNYLNERRKSFPPGYNIYTRLLAESGIIGLLVFFLFLYSFFWQSVRLKNDKEYRHIGIVIIVSLSGFVLNWFQTDTFRTYGFWLCLALLCFYIKKKRLI